jgi:hypothetical protein
VVAGAVALGMPAVVNGGFCMTALDGVVALAGEAFAAALAAAC